MVLMVVGVLLAAPLIVVLYQWVRWDRLRRHAPATSIAAWIGTLLRDFAPGAVLIAEPNGKDGFIQFALTQRRKEWRTLEFGLPETEWSRPVMGDIQALLDSAGVSWTYADLVGVQATPRFLRAEFVGERTDILHRMSNLVPHLAVAMGYSVHQTYRIRLLGSEAPEYRRELGEKLENMPGSGRFEKKLAALVRGRADRN